MTDKEWDLIIEPKRKLLDLPIREVIRYRDLIVLFIKRDFVIQYKQTILGPLWFVINPLISTVMYIFVFGNLAKLSTDGVPHILFYYAGTMLWTFFSGCFTDATNIFVTNKDLFGKVYFPRLTVPISNIFGNLTRITVQFIFLLVFFIYYLVTPDVLKPSFAVFAFPLLLIWIAALGTGMGMIISALTTKYRDLRILVTFALKFSWVLYANPLSVPVELFRVWFYGAGTVTLGVAWISIAETILLLFLGLIMFNQNERNFIDVV